MIASPTTSTGISVSLIRADTVAGDTARISVPSTKISPLIRKTRLKQRGRQFAPVSYTTVV